jgi:endo-1,4-beta-mannosidase
LNDLPDLTYRPLYTDWARYDAQTAFVVERYRSEPTILAWDLRNEGDIDYGALSPDTARFTRQQVLDWLAHISQLVNGLDANHLTTAGWLGNPTVTSASVDFLSFHHWSGADYLRNRVAYYRSLSSQPLLVEEVGRHTWSSAPPDPQAESVQADFFQSVIGAAEAQNLAGWVVWTAFDFFPPPGQPANYQHFYGLWRTDLSPKPALSVLPLGP